MTLARLTSAFPAWVLIASVAALWQPPLFTWFSGWLIPAGLAVIMLGMGLTLDLEDFRAVARRPRLLALGLALQYSVMPLLGWACAAIFLLPPPLAVGLILVACCPGGTASNVIAFLARAHVPLSVAMTATSTLTAAVATPLLATGLASSRVDVPTTGLLVSTVQVVILPVAAGLALKRWAPGLTLRLLPAAPLAAVIMITLIVASIVGAGREQLVEAGARLLGAVLGLHAAGFAIGYGFAAWFSADVQVARTVSIEVGMQNSGLGVVLARGNFADPLVAIPSALSSVTHSLIGSLMAAVWRRSPPSPAGQAPRGAPEPSPRAVI